MSNSDPLLMENWLEKLLPSWIDTSDSRLTPPERNSQETTGQIFSELNLDLGIMDTHFHLDIHDNPKEVVKGCDIQGVFTIAVTTSPAMYPYTEKLAQESKYVFPAIGLHPLLVSQRRQDLPKLWEYLNRTRFVGEIGLDNSVEDDSDYSFQKDVFEETLDRCAKYGDKIFTIHARKTKETRNVVKDVLDVIGENYPGKFILHWYSGTAEELERAFTNGIYFSINRAMFHIPENLEIIKIMPKSRVLLETDGPVLLLDRKPMTPINAEHIIGLVSDIWNINISETKDQLGKNLKTFLDIKNETI